MSPPSEASCNPDQECLAANTTGDHFSHAGSSDGASPSIMVRATATEPASQGTAIRPEPFAEQPMPCSKRIRKPTVENDTTTPSGGVTAHHDDKRLSSSSLWQGHGVVFPSGEPKRRGYCGASGQALQDRYSKRMENPPQDLLGLAMQLQAESSLSQRREPETNRYTASTPTVNDAMSW